MSGLVPRRKLQLGNCGYWWSMARFCLPTRPNISSLLAYTIKSPDYETFRHVADDGSETVDPRS